MAYWVLFGPVLVGVAGLGAFHIGCVSVDFLRRRSALSPWDDRNSETQAFYPVSKKLRICSLRKS